METLFPAVPEDLSVLSAEELSDLLASFQTVSAALRAGDVDLSEHYPDLSDAERSTRVMDDWRSAAEAVQAIRAAQAELQASVDEGERTAAELHADIVGERETEEDSSNATEQPAEDAAPVVVEDEPAEELAKDDDAADDEASDKKDDEEDDKVEAAAEVVTAGARPAIRYPAVPKSRRVPDSPSASGTSMYATAAGGAIKAGDEISAREYADLVVETMRRRGRVVKHKDGGRENIALAHAEYDFPPEFTLNARDPEGNTEKLAAIGNPYLGREAVEALAASGGICAPPTPFYDLPNFSTTDRPVRDGLPSFQADRGGVSVPSVSTLESAADSISIIEASDDAEGGSAATKSCMPMECATWVDTFIGAISHCREIGNFNARTWPEGVAHENQNTMALHARTAEGRLLDNIDALSLDLTRAAVYGASSSLLYALTISRVGIISRLRMDPNSRFNVILPFYAADMFSSDITNGANGGADRFDTPASAVGGLLSQYGFNAIWHLDEGLNGDTEVWPNETDNSPQEDWPGSIIIARVFPAGHFIHLDGGTLDFGLVRDSGLNHTNDYELMAETFENVFAVGPTQAAHRLEITACPSGTLAALSTPFTCSAT